MINYVAIEIYDDMIVYDGQKIYFGDVKKLNQEIINTIINNYKKSIEEDDFYPHNID